MVKCKICNFDKSKYLFTKNNRNLFQCLDCKTVFVSDNITEHQIQEFYSYNYYYKLRYYDPTIGKRYKELLNRFVLYRKNNLLLDVGCGSGQFMKSAQEESWNVTGVEISREIRDWAVREHNLNVLAGDLPDLTFDSDKFDVVTMFEVIEHLRQPKIYLREIFRILRKGGILFLTTPNYNSLSRILIGSNWSFIEEKHLFYFTPSSLKSILQNIGFKTVKLNTKNITVNEIVNRLPFVHTKMKKSPGAERFKLRDRIETSRPLTLLKKNINFFLNLFGIGDSIWIFAEK